MAVVGGGEEGAINESYRSESARAPGIAFTTICPILLLPWRSPIRLAAIAQLAGRPENGAIN